MDRKSLIQFLVASGVILLLWLTFMGLFGGRPSPQPAPPAGEQEAGEVVAEPPSGPDERPVGEQEQEGEVLGDLVIGNDVIRTSWTNKGAALESLELLRYGATYFDGEQDGEARPALMLLRDIQEGYFSDVIESARYAPAADGEEAEPAWSAENLTSGILYDIVDRSEHHIVFEAVLPERRKVHLWREALPRLKVRKRVEVSDGQQDYHYNVTLDITNVTDRALQFEFSLRGAAGIGYEKATRRPIRTAVGCQEGRGKYDVEHVAPKDVPEDPNKSADIVWAGTVNQYFVALTQPARADWVASVATELVVDSDLLAGRGRWKDNPALPADLARRAALANSNVAAVMRSTVIRIEPGETRAFRYRMVAAPKLDAVLAQYEDGMTKALEFGIFPSLSRWLLATLNAFHWLIPNYGVAILMLTVLVRIVLSPLTWKGQVSMHKMQLLGPKLSELRKKLGDDKQKMAQEQMRLFRSYGVHPMSGCWPMLLQMPVFLALFGTLSNAVELRHALFIPGWVTDLSQPDTVANLPAFLPLIGGMPVNILPIIMVTVSFISQRSQPKPVDPQAQQQQKMMKWMPLFFAFILYRFASGLVLYWTASTSIGLLEQWLIRKRLAKTQIRSVEEQQAAAKRGKRSREPARKGIFERLTEAVDTQQKKSQMAQSRRKK